MQILYLTESEARRKDIHQTSKDYQHDRDERSREHALRCPPEMMEGTAILKQQEQGIHRSSYQQVAETHCNPSECRQRKNEPLPIVQKPQRSATIAFDTSGTVELRAIDSAH